MHLNNSSEGADSDNSMANIQDNPWKIEADLPENTDSDLAISTESPRGGEQLDELMKVISIFLNIDF